MASQTINRYTAQRTSYRNKVNAKIQLLRKINGYYRPIKLDQRLWPERRFIFA